MKIVMITGSPRRNGTSARIADAFVAGAEEKGHTVLRFDAAFETVGSCRACYYCDSHDGQCFQRDAMDRILPQVFDADMIVLVTPIYFYNMSGPLKLVLDRFRARRDDFHAHPMKSAVIATCGGPPEWSMDAVDAHYRCLLKFLPWDDQGVLYFKNITETTDMQGTEHIRAREFGLSL